MTRFANLATVSSSNFSDTPPTFFQKATRTNLVTFSSDFGDFWTQPRKPKSSVISMCCVPTVPVLHRFASVPTHFSTDLASATSKFSYTKVRNSGKGRFQLRFVPFINLCLKKNLWIQRNMSLLTELINENSSAAEPRYSGSFTIEDKKTSTDCESCPTRHPQGLTC